jgi:hypothetical protein
LYWATTSSAQQDGDLSDLGDLGVQFNCNVQAEAGTRQRRRVCVCVDFLIGSAPSPELYASSSSAPCETS